MQTSVRTYAATLLTAISLLLPITALAQTTVLLDAPNSESIDTTIRGGSYAAKNFDGQPLATRASTNLEYRRRALLKFDTERTVPAKAAIQSATLTLTVKGGNSETRRLAAYRITKSFDEGAATWMKRKSSYSWSSAGGDLGAKYAESTVYGTPGSKVSFNVTKLVQEVVNGTYGSRWTRIAVLDPGGSTSASYREFHPSEATDPSVRPVLKVVYGGTSSTSTSTSTSSSTSTSTSTSTTTTTGGALPSGWATRDIGGVAAAGRASYLSGRFIVGGSGQDVWSTSDEFRFAYRTLTGNGEIVARVESIQNIDPWVKAGVMMRETLSAGSRHAFMMVTPGKGLAFQRRTATGNYSTHTSGGSGSAPRYVKLVRTDGTFRAYKSTDGSSWTLVGSSTIPMASTIYVGLAVTSHDDGAVAEATFTNTAVRTTTATTTTTTPTTSTSTSTSTLKVLHWNVHHGGIRSDGVYDPEGLTTWMASFKADIYSLNEVDSTTKLSAIVSRMKTKTGRTWYYHYDYGIAILSRFPLESKSSCVINPSLGRKTVQLAVVVNGRRINVWSAHLDAYSSTRRQTEAKGLLACASSFSEQKIIAGDFNAGASSTEVGYMKQYYVDAWAAAKALGTTTNYYGNCDGCTRNGRIDYVFTSKGATALVLKSAQVFDTRDSRGVMASDHKPLLVTYAVK